VTTPNGPTTSASALPPSEPVAVSIPALDVRSPVIPVGKNPDGSLAVPSPGPDLDKVAWYQGSATPGAPGPAVFTGHAATAGGPSVFADLRTLGAHSRVFVTRADGVTAVFTVTEVDAYPSAAFPVARVFGSNLALPSLRLVSDSHRDPSTGQRTGNTVVYAHLTAVHPAGP
jgi:hypothetical protein